MRFKTFLHGLILLGCIATLGYHVIWGNRGILRFYELKKEVVKQQRIVAQLQHDVKTLQGKILTWQTSDFEKEKVAREDLQMGKRNELVYVLPKE